MASAFSQMLNLHNLSEEISNAQIEKASRIGEVRFCVTTFRRQIAALAHNAEIVTACAQHSVKLLEVEHHGDVHMLPQIEASTRSTNKSFKKLVADKLATPELIYETICNQTVDLVFTAHPTQVCHQRSILMCMCGHAFHAAAVCSGCEVVSTPRGASTSRRLHMVHISKQQCDRQRCPMLTSCHPVNESVTLCCCRRSGSRC